ncbi:hypothetical protein H8R02_25465 [Ramlibacter sp. GTP1]|uniref:Alpha/beta hydrolase domain-containing protein n=1 Tax=Ramlibacter albus TaxID=2079448 RepID=A0A923MCV5_9BURK|nr:hypothetical protein [Ramlibacter albus]
MSFFVTSVATAHAQVVRFEVLQSTPAYGGRSFGSVGPYVKVTARATIALDPADPRNAVIVDIDKAPRNAAGRVEATADVVVLRPADPARGNGTLFVDVPNRGRRIGQQLFDDALEANSLDKGDAGNGFLERQGYTVAWIGWQADLESKPGQMGIQAPVLRGVTGPVREEFVFDHMRNPATATLQWPVADPSKLAVTVRPTWDAPRQTPVGLAVRATGANTIEIQRPASGFDAGALYEVTYTGRDPIVLGMGFAATRDVAAFLRRDTSASNPLAVAGRPSVHHAIGFGVSQSGRFLRDFLHLGFNEDLLGRTVFDGLMPHVAGGRRMATNVRFGLPNRNSRHPQDPAWQVDTFPFTYAVLEDPLTGRRDGLMLRCRLNATCPRVIHTDSEHEWWASRASLNVTDLAGNHLDLPPDVRAYMLTGTPHYAAPNERVKTVQTMALPVNPLHNGASMRALLTAMQEWITTGKEPPASRVPMRAHGTLVEAQAAVPAGIPGLPYAGIHSAARVSDQSVFPPRELGGYPVFVPKADADGMSIAGVRQLALAVPRATYTGWNPRAAGFGADALFPLQGAVVPFAATRAQRQAANDPRPSLEERYASNAAYVAAVRAAADRLVAERLLLPEDAQRSVELATQDNLAQLR